MQTQRVAPKHARFTAIGGRIAPDVAAVRLYFHRHGSPKRSSVEAILGRVDCDLHRRLKQPAPFGFFYAKIGGLVRLSAFKAQALDLSGKIIGTAGGYLLSPSPSPRRSESSNMQVDCGLDDPR
jgi:hypothetical protein